jgi:hypothetical protein
LLPVRQFDLRIGLTRAFADALNDSRDPNLTENSLLEMVRSCVYGILAGYEDQKDHDTLRADLVFKLAADRSPEDHHLASQPTLSRFVVTHRPGATLLPEPTYDEYGGRGESENHNIRAQV